VPFHLRGENIVLQWAFKLMIYLAVANTWYLKGAVPKVATNVGNA
jgi:hypothetical protein